MSTTSTPRAPATGNTSMPKAGTPTGSWRHPAMDTIVQRQSKQKGLADIHSSRLAKNSGAFVATFVFTWLLHTWLLRRNPAYGKQPERHPVWDDIMWLGGYILNTLRIVLLYNMGESTYRLLRPEPDFSDLPLNPMQRKLLGLAPNVDSHATAGGYITPPRYPRSPPPSPPPPRYPRSPPPSPSSTFGGSPGPSSNGIPSSFPYSAALSTTTSSSSPPHGPSPRHTFSSATDGPMTPSPLRSTTRGGTMAQSLGFSVGSGSTVSPQNSIFNTPSPRNRTGQGLGLGYGSASGAVGPSGVPMGNRWVYEKMGKRGEGLRWTPGRNSVFSPVKGQVN